MPRDFARQINNMAAMSRFLLFMLLVQSFATTNAATYQVGPTRTYHTVGALPALTAGDIVEVDPATYNEVKRWTVSGTAAKPIIIRGVGGHAANFRWDQPGRGWRAAASTRGFSGRSEFHHAGESGVSECAQW